MVQNRFEVLGKEDEQVFKIRERVFPSKQLPPTLPPGQVRIRNLQFANCGWCGNNISQSATVVQVTDQGMGVSHDAVEDTCR